MTTTRRMLPTDTFAWKMEADPVLRSTVVAVAHMDRVPDWDYLRARIGWMTEQVEALRQRVRPSSWRVGGLEWALDEEFDLDYHLRRVCLPAGGTWPDVLELARVAAMADFDRSRPLWEFTLVEGLPNGESAFITKLHHALSDGIGGLQLAALVLDAGPDLLPIEMLPQLVPDAHSGNGLHSLLGAGVRLIVPTAARTLANPLAQLRNSLVVGTSVAHMVQPILSTASPVMTRRHTVRRLHTFDVPLSQLRDAAHAQDAHVNDAFLTALTGGLRRYHERLGSDVESLRVTMPISIRKPGDPIGGNRITLMRFRVPVGIKDPARRMREMRRQTSTTRAERAIPLTQAIAFGLNLAPRQAIQSMLRRVDFLASDVPGLSDHIYFAGARIIGYYPFGPTIGAALNTTLMSYVDTCCIGVNIDVAAVTEPDLMIEDLTAGFDEVLALAPAGKDAAETISVTSVPA